MDKALLMTAGMALIAGLVTIGCASSKEQTVTGTVTLTSAASGKHRASVDGLPPYAGPGGLDYETANSDIYINQHTSFVMRWRLCSL